MTLAVVLVAVAVAVMVVEVVAAVVGVASVVASAAAAAAAVASATAAGVGGGGGCGYGGDGGDGGEAPVLCAHLCQVDAEEGQVLLDEKNKKRCLVASKLVRSSADGTMAIVPVLVSSTFCAAHGSSQ